MAEIGVVLPVFNGEQHLRQALDSIARQTHQPTEVVAVDDGSTDRSVAILESFGARVLHSARAGQAAARNVGVAAVRGHAVAFLDQDDVWKPTKLERQLAVLAADPELGFVGAHSSVFVDPGSERPAWWKPSWDEGGAEPSLLPSATLYRRTALELVGGFRGGADLTVCEDVDWTARAQDLGVRRAVVPEVLVAKRVHGGNASNDRSAVVAEQLAIARASIARKRAAGA
ncbi:MAG: glycosyltransferase family 2 protein [Solirubrobacteraceae bacterium]|nr:glycosyltransferase family 2 protein [Solirubrobacteraceae bacterium]